MIDPHDERTCPECEARTWRCPSCEEHTTTLRVGTICDGCDYLEEVRAAREGTPTRNRALPVGWQLEGRMTKRFLYAYSGEVDVEDPDARLLAGAWRCLARGASASDEARSSMSLVGRALAGAEVLP